MFQSSQTCHPEARRAEGTGPKPPYVRNHRFLRPFGPQDDRSGKIRGDYVFTSNRNHTRSEGVRRGQKGSLRRVARSFRTARTLPFRAEPKARLFLRKKITLLSYRHVFCKALKRLARAVLKKRTTRRCFCLECKQNIRSGVNPPRTIRTFAPCRTLATCWSNTETPVR
jgi:hypothetical protein